MSCLKARKYLFIMLRTIDMIITVIKNTIEYNPYLKTKFNHPSPERTHMPQRGYNRKYHLDELLRASAVALKTLFLKAHLIYYRF